MSRGEWKKETWACPARGNSPERWRCLHDPLGRVACFGGSVLAVLGPLRAPSPAHAFSFGGLMLRDHFGRFAAVYDSRYAKGLGNRVVARFLTCGDYRQGVARIRCANPERHHEYLRPFSCKAFFLCPSCSQKRTLLFAEYLDEQLLLTLPHRQLVFTS